MTIFTKVVDFKNKKLNIAKVSSVTTTEGK